MTPVQTIPVRGDHITLGQLLKVAGLVGTGGEAKTFLADISIRVNGERENRRGRKLRPGDVVIVAGQEEIRLVADETAGG